jgi:D-sedoheptulose 7-phosphate isomerase
MNSRINSITKELDEHLNSVRKIFNNKELLNQILIISQKCISAIKKGNKIIFIGNGGSAADAMHLTAELVGKLKFKRKPLPAIDLVSNPSILTSIGNDYKFEDIFTKQIESVGKKGDILIAITTSGLSKNIINAIKISDKIGLDTIILTGNKKNYLNKYKSYILKVPDTNTQRIQECHILIGHIFCSLIENAFVKKIN